MTQKDHPGLSLQLFISGQPPPLPFNRIDCLNVIDRYISFKRLACHQNISSSHSQVINKVSRFKLYFIRCSIGEESLCINSAMKSNFPMIFFSKKLHLHPFYLLERLQYIHTAMNKIRDQRFNSSTGMLLVKSSVTMSQVNQSFRISFKELSPHAHAEKQRDLCSIVIMRP